MHSTVSLSSFTTQPVSYLSRDQEAKKKGEAAETGALQYKKIGKFPPSQYGMG